MLKIPSVVYIDVWGCRGGNPFLLMTDNTFLYIWFEHSAKLVLSINLFVWFVLKYMYVYKMHVFVLSYSAQEKLEGQ